VAQTEPNLRDYWWVVRRRKWFVIVPPVLLGALTYVMAQAQAPAPLYRATAIVKFERTFNVNTLLLRDIVGVSPVGDLDTNAALVKSTPVLARAAQKLGRLPATATADDVPSSPTYQAVIQSLGAQIEVTRTDRTSLIEITATAGNPGEATRMANSVAEAFRDNDIAARTHQIVEARRFIEGQLADVGRRLQQSEEQLRSFQEANKVLLLQEEARAALARLAEHEAERERLEREIHTAELELRRVAKDNTVDAIAATGDGPADAAVSKLQTTLSELALERDTLLLTLRPAHPQVRAIDAKIVNVRGELAAVVGAHRARVRKTLSAQLEMLAARRAQLAKVIGDLNTKVGALPAVALEAARIEREVKVNERIFSLLKERLQEALIKEKEQVAEVAIVRPAIASRVPVNEPQTAQRAVIGVVLGLVVGLVVAFTVETLDTSIAAIHDLESLLETPILGVMAHLDPDAEDAANEHASTVSETAGGDGFAFLPTIFAPRSALAEAVRGLRTNLLFRVLDRDVKTIVITSTSQAEGKTTIAVNLAIALAQLGKKTLLVEADLRNPSIYRIFGSRRSPGLTDVVLGSVALDDAVQNFADLMLGHAGMEHLLDAPGTDHFFLLPSGLRAPNPSDLISSRGFTTLLAEARQHYDYVILDSAPVFSVADASILASQADGILCVVRVGHVPRAALRRAKGMLDRTKTPLLGLCLNGVRAEVSPDFHELSYHYRYGARPNVLPLREQLGQLWTPQTGRPHAIAAGLAALVALGLTMWGVNRATEYLLRRAATMPPAAQIALTEAAAGAPGARAVASAPAPGAHADAPAKPARASAAVSSPRVSFTVRLSAPGYRAGDVRVGQFTTEAEARAFGEELVRAGMTSSFDVIAISDP